jgi:replicative DNA helicase
MENSVETRLDHVIPPRAHEIEIRALSALIHLGDPKNVRVQTAMLKLDQDCFMQMDHRTIFKLLQELFAKGNPFDFVEFIGIIPNELYDFVSLSVTDHYMFPNHLEHDVAKLLSFRSLRRHLKVLVNAANRGLEEALPEDGIKAIREELQSLSNADSSQHSSIVRSYEVEIDEMLCESDSENVDFPVNIPDLPNVPNRSLITIAGRSGHGKTFFALYLMDAIIDAHPNKQTLYFNLEMHPRVMIERHGILLGARGANRKELIRGAAHILLPKNVSLVSVPMITIEQIESESRIAALKQPICCIVVDYLSLVGSKAKYDAKYLQQNDIAKRLAALSLELNCVVLGLIQVNREFKTRPIGDRCPLTSDASESMGSVHSSSWWIGIDQPQNDDPTDEYQHLFQVACRKNRGDAGLFTLNLKFKNGMFSKYYRPFCPKPIERDGF